MSLFSSIPMASMTSPLTVGAPIMQVSPATLATHCSYPPGKDERLIVPLDGSLRRKGLNFFLPLKKRTALRLRSLTRLLSGTTEHTHFRESQVMQAIKNLAGDPSLHTVISIGTPGPYRKYTVLLLNNEGTQVAVAKIGTTPKAIDQVRKEAHWLRVLTAEPAMRHCTPAFIAEDNSADAWIVVQSVCTGKFVDTVLGPPQLQFLSAFQQLFQEELMFRDSVMYRDIAGRFARLQSRLSPAWVNRTKRALSVLEAGLAHVTMRVVGAHRDFAPWNMRLQGGRLAVFDWEYASTGYLPLYDLFHFHLVPIAVKSIVSPSRLRRILEDVARQGASLGKPTRKPYAPALQLLAYLLDVSLFYLESNEGVETGDAIVQCFSGLIDDFDVWSASDIP